MYPRNAASPPRIVVGSIYQISDGAKQTTGASATVTPQGGSETAAGGTLACLATSGEWVYTPTQAETNYTAFVVAVYKASCTSASVTVVTTAESTAGKVSLGSAQTANITGNLTGSIGSLGTQAKADVNAEVDAALNTATPASPTADSINERLKTLDDNYTAPRANKLDNLDATVSSRLAASVCSGITSLGNWLRALARSDAADATAKTEINSGGGTWDEAADSDQARRDRGDAAWTTATAVALTDAGQQDIAQILRATKGTVWFVATDGNDGNSGLSPDQAKLSPKTVIEAASAGDVVILGPGQHDLGSAWITIPAGVAVYGVGLYTTEITTTASVAVNIGSRCVLSDMTVISTHASGKALGLPAATDFRLSHVRADGHSDGIYSTSSSSAARGQAIDCIFRAQLDAIGALTIHADSVLDFVRCQLVTYGTGTSSGVTGNNGTLNFFDSNFLAYSSDSYAVGAQSGGANIRIFGGSVWADGTSENSLKRTAGSLVVCGTEYDRSKTSGTITVVSGLDSPMAASPTPDSIAERIKALDTDIYTADVQLTIDEANTQDEYTVTWFKNGLRITSGITSPTIQVVKRADGTDLIAATAMTQIGSTGSYKYDEATSRITAGEAALVIVSATIDGSSRSFGALLSRDSTA